MRLIIKTTPNKELIPFNYQPKLTSVLHKWLGKDNVEHGAVSMYCFSWLNNLRITNKGFNANNTTNWFINFYDDEKLKTIIKAIQTEPYIFSGMEASEIVIQENPVFDLGKARFNVANPVFLKIKSAEGKTDFVYYNDANASGILTTRFESKLTKAGLDAKNVKVYFDTEYNNAKIKGFEHNGTFNKGSICPIIIEGSAEQIAFAWNVGVGNSTGIGFGALI